MQYWCPLDRSLQGLDKHCHLVHLYLFMHALPLMPCSLVCPVSMLLTAWCWRTLAPPVDTVCLLPDKYSLPMPDIGQSTHWQPTLNIPLTPLALASFPTRLGLPQNPTYLTPLCMQLPLFICYHAMIVLWNIGTPTVVDALAAGLSDNSALFK